MVPDPARLRAWVRSSPWLLIAVLLHALLIVILSVVFIRTQRSERPSPATEIAVARAPLELPPAIDELPVIDRSQVPPATGEDERAVAPDESYIPDAAAGRAGEITDETDPTLEAGIFNPDPEALPELSSGATGGTPMGVGHVGHFSAGTSAFSGRRAGGGGPGGGGLGEQGGRNRPDAGAQKAVLKALLWLANHQSSDGSWDADGFTSQCRKNACGGIGDAAHDVGVTGLALLAFLGAGETHSEGSFRSTVKEGLRWLISVQDEEGCFGARIGQQFLYDHACATLAMAEAYGMTQAKPFRDSAQRGIQFVLRSQTSYSGWRYASPSDGDSDTSVTGWMVMVLKSGKLAGLTIDDQAIVNALGWIDEMTNPSNGRTGYTDFGGFPSRLPNVEAQFPPQRSESTTAVGVLTRIFAGRTLDEDPMIAKGADLMSASPPRWDTTTGHIDFYYWYYGTLAMFQVGGPRWDKWNEAIKTAMLDHQRLDDKEDEFGSWDPVDPWSTVGGRIYSTALNCLSMEVYYRYPRVFGATTNKKKRRGLRSLSFLQRRAARREASRGIRV